MRYAKLQYEVDRFYDEKITTLSAIQREKLNEYISNSQLYTNGLETDYYGSLDKLIALDEGFSSSFDTMTAEISKLEIEQNKKDAYLNRKIEQCSRYLAYISRYMC